MRRTIISCLVLLLSLFCFEANAQAKDWFVKAGMGFQVYRGEDDNLALFEDRPSYYYTVAVGKWLSPVIGVQLSGNWGILKGASIEKEPYSISPLEGSGDYPNAVGFFEKFKHYSFQPEVIFNCYNCFFGYNPKRVWNVNLTAGMGFAHSFQDSQATEKASANSFNVAFGVISHWQVCRNVGIFLNGKYTLLTNKKFDHVATGNLDDMFSLTAGVSVNFGK